MTTVKDFSLGVLIMVIAFFPLFFTYWLANNPDLLTWLGIIFGIIVYNAIFNLGWRIAFEGIKVNDN
jgi:uncharacterized membrane protein